MRKKCCFGLKLWEINVCPAIMKLITFVYWENDLFWFSVFGEQTVEIIDFYCR